MGTNIITACDSSDRKRPKRPKCPIASNDAPFESDILRTLAFEPIAKRPAARATPRPRRRALLSDELIATLDPEPRQYYIWDTKKKGLGVRVGASGTVAFVLKINGRDKERGKYSVWLTLKAATVEDARAEYHTEMARHESKEPAPPKKENPLWQDVVDRYRREELPGLKESTQSTYGSALNHVSKAFRNRPVRTLSHEDIKAFHLSMSETPRQANVCVNLCGIILDRCEFWRYRDLDSNPVRYLRKSSWKKNREPQRKRKWKPGELEQLGAALQTMQATESPYPIAAVRLLIFTGKRLREILDLQWDQIDLESRTITWEETKTGEMEAPLNDWALEVLQSLPRLKYKDEDGTVKDHPFVLPGAEPGASIRDLTKFWNRLLKLAGITNLHRHDLRHLHGHESAGLGQNPQTTAALLGHSDFASTARYSKTDHDPALEASQKVAGSLAGKMKGGRK